MQWKSSWISVCVTVNETGLFRMRVGYQLINTIHALMKTLISGYDNKLSTHYI